MYEGIIKNIQPITSSDEVMDAVRKLFGTCNSCCHLLDKSTYEHCSNCNNGEYWDLNKRHLFDILDNILVIISKIGLDIIEDGDCEMVDAIRDFLHPCDQRRIRQLMVHGIYREN